VVLTEAADEARVRAPERAEQLCERALELLPVDSALRPGIQSIRCRALARASRPADAVTAGLAAMAGLPAGPERAHTATALVSSLFSTGRIDEAIGVVDGEIAASPSPALRASRALLLGWAGRDADALAESALAERSAGDAPDAERVQVFTQLTMLSSMLIRHQDTAGYADRALAAAGTATTLRLQALAVGASTSALAGLVHDASARLARAEPIGRDTSLFRGELLITAITLDWLRGRWDEALRGLSSVAAELTTNRQTMLAGAAQAIELDIRSWRGELDLAERLASRPAPRPRNVAGLHAVALSDYLTARGDVCGALRMLEPVLADPAGLPYACVLLGRLIELRLEAGDDARPALATLTAVASGRFAPWSRVTVHRATGLVHGDLDALRRAVAEAEAAELVFEQARAVLAIGLRTDDSTEELVGAYQAFAAMGAHGLRRTAGRRLRELGAKVPRVRSRATGLLSEAEEKIARLVRQGMRNREIAAALHYSPRSVEVYLSRIYAKLKISSRLELARVLDTTDRLQRGDHPS
jgi:DNA-binding CsgD family transcriptional regulator